MYWSDLLYTKYGSPRSTRHYPRLQQHIKHILKRIFKTQASEYWICPGGVVNRKLVPIGMLFLRTLNTVTYIASKFALKISAAVLPLPTVIIFYMFRPLPVRHYGITDRRDV